MNKRGGDMMFDAPEMMPMMAEDGMAGGGAPVPMAMPMAPAEDMAMAKMVAPARM